MAALKARRSELELTKNKGELLPSRNVCVWNNLDLGTKCQGSRQTVGSVLLGKSGWAPRGVLEGGGEEGGLSPRHGGGMSGEGHS